jgi:fatty acid desaturase
MNSAPQPPSLAAKILALVGGAILLVLGFMFSLVLLSVLVVVGLALGAWFFWKTRHLRKAMREAAARRRHRRTAP